MVEHFQLSPNNLGIETSSTHLRALTPSPRPSLVSQNSEPSETNSRSPSNIQSTWGHEVTQYQGTVVLSDHETIPGIVSSTPLLSNLPLSVGEYSARYAASKLVLQSSLLSSAIASYAYWACGSNTGIQSCYIYTYVVKLSPAKEHGLIGRWLKDR